MGRFRVRQKHSQHTRDVSGALCISRHHKDVRCTALTGYRVRQWKKLPHKCRHVLERTFPLKRVCLGHACGRHTCLLKLKIAQLGKSFALRRAQKVCLDVGRLLRHRQRRFGLLLSYRRLFSALRFGMLATLALFLRGCIYSIWYRRCLFIVGLGNQMLVQQEPIVQVVAHEALGSGGGTFYGLRHRFRALLSRAPGTTRSNASLCLLALWFGEAHRANFLLRASSALCRRTKMWARSHKRRLWSFVRVVD